MDRSNLNKLLIGYSRVGMANIIHCLWHKFINNRYEINNVPHENYDSGFLALLLFLIIVFFLILSFKKLITIK